MKKLNLLKSMLLLCALMAGSTSAWAVEKWVKTAPADLQTGDIVVVVDQSSGKAMTNNNGTSSVPSAVAVTLNGDKSEITSSVGSTIQWTLTTSGSGSGKTFQFANGTNFLYVTKSNTGLKVGSGERNTFTIVSGGDNSGYYLYNHNGLSGSSADERYVGCYNSSEWRCYTSINSNIRGNNNAFYRKVTVASFPAGKTMISFSDASNALDLITTNLPSGLAAYKVSAANASSVTLTAVNSTVAKNTGVILTGTAGETYNIPVVGSGSDISGSNLLVASDGTSNVENAYVLSAGKFHPVQDGGLVIPAGKAYLPAGSLSAHELDITFDNGDVTAISEIEKVRNGGIETFFDLQGRKVAQPTKGLYIMNGKKVIIK